MKTAITITVDTDGLSNFTDEYLAQLWHAAQANQASDIDLDAAGLVHRLGFEIIRRWLKKAPVSLYRFQAGELERQSLVTLGARFIDGAWRMSDPSSGSSEVRP